jgi:acyl-CoA reductase-like NAD-dependent aldehyde dehydrogenase
MATVSTPWGRASPLEEIAIQQEADGREFASLVQLLENDAGERLVHFAYSTGGAVRRGPVTFRAADVELLRASLREHGQLAQALGWEAGKEVVERRA